MGLSLAQRVASLPEDERQAILSGFDPEALLHDWLFWGREEQLLPINQPNWAVALYIAGRGAGKQLCLNTPIPTPTGWTTMGNLKIGDEVFDEAGRPCRVVATFSTPPERCYRITFSDGTHIDADADHLWATWTRRDRKQYLRANPGAVDFPENWPAHRQPLHSKQGNTTGRVGPEIRTTQQILDTLTHPDHRHPNHCIPVTGALDLPEADLPLPPYTLGHWLGNGNNRDGTITCGDTDTDAVIAAICATGMEAPYCHDIPENGRSTIRVEGIAAILRGMGLLRAKRIPPAYLRASAEQRLALLRGLMDSGGTVFKSRCEFGSMAEELARDVLELVRTLSERPVLTTKRVRIESGGHGTLWLVRWRPSRHNPFALPRKADGVPPLGSRGLRSRHRMITAIEAIPVAPMRCITVDSPHSMYLAGEGMIPTHNTRTGTEWARHKAMQEKGSRGFFVARTAADVRDVLVQGASGVMSVCPPSERPEWEPSKRLLTFPNGSTILCFSASEPDQLRGPQANWALCVAEGTPIQTKRGPIPIEHITPTDEVLVRDGRHLPLKGGAKLTRPNTETLRITTPTTTTQLTPDHKVWTANGWVEAQNLTTRDTVLTNTGHIPILNIEPAGRAHTYDLTVNGDLHEFFAGGILVHNCDEAAAWDYRPDDSGATAWQNVEIATRLGDRPQIFAATTPKRTPWTKEMLNRAEQRPGEVLVIRGSTRDNAGNLSTAYLNVLYNMYEGTALARQELEGELIEDVEGALWTAAMFDDHRVKTLPEGLRFVVGVDPSVSENPTDECGIVVVGATGEPDMYRRHAYVVEDASILGAPDLWAKAAAAAAIRWGAPIVVEGNQGGQLVRMAIAQVNDKIPIYTVFARHGKATRAEPIVAAYQQGRVHHLGIHPDLETQCTSWEPARSRKSPDRLDACVWACTSLLTKPTKGGLPLSFGGSLTARSYAGRRLPPMNSTTLTNRGKRRR